MQSNCNIIANGGIRVDHHPQSVRKDLGVWAGRRIDLAETVEKKLV